MPTRLVDHDLLDEEQRQQLSELQILPEQKRWSGDIAGALHTLTSAPCPGIKGFALLDDERPVAFLLLKRPPFLPPWADEKAATLHALQVDSRQQGRGYGRACLRALPAASRAVWPRVRQLMLSVDSDNLAAMGLYLSEGWVDSGTAYRGRVGYERRLSLKI
ncbi:GNAT family N-acetyltransferase [Pseudomonas sp. HR96]|uniref:GNAT family N-acetyltransferase n=1 Tax=Pseudomonas sp. HR96 TaxID=1027966 RepID=UPI002A7483DD|nr:GNAT family N-acetyltransferase [Pseudomonas sp. HR96]WPP01119.1 GNAT family N-acetyltransferase [Pseudomonas sp. HR96]